MNSNTWIFEFIHNRIDSNYFKHDAIIQRQFTYLFYKGQKDYEQHRPCEPFFDRYGSLLNCLRVRTAPSFFQNTLDGFQDSDAFLSCWSDWLDELSRTLKQ